MIELCDSLTHRNHLALRHESPSYQNQFSETFAEKRPSHRRLRRRPWQPSRFVAKGAAILVSCTLLFLGLLLFLISLLPGMADSSQLRIQWHQRRLLRFPRSTPSQDHRFLLYLPHSQLNNQLIELQNAMILARSLNRTLVLPPLYLGMRELYRRRFRVLRSLLRRVEETFDMAPVLTNQSSQVERFIEKRLIALKTRLDHREDVSRDIIPLSVLFDVNLLRQWVRFCTVHELMEISSQRPLDFWKSMLVVYEDLPYHYRFVDALDKTIFDRNGRLVDGQFTGLDSLKELESDVNEKQSTASASDKLRYLEFWDNSQNARMMTIDLQNDTNNSFKQTIPMDKYHHVINLEALNHQTADIRFLVFGSLFGSTRLHLTLPENINLLQDIQSNFLFDNPVLNRIAESVVEQLGGSLSYLGVHLRLTEGNFLHRQQSTIARVNHAIQNISIHEFIGGPINNTAIIYVATDLLKKDVDGSLLDDIRQSGTVKTWHDFSDELIPRVIRSLLEEAEFNRDCVVNRMDQEDGRRWALSRPFDMLFCQHNSFCETEALQSSWADFLSQSSPKNSNRRNETVPRTNSTAIPTSENKISFDQLKWFIDQNGSLKKIWVPLLDQIIASRGYAFVGTQSSTYSRLTGRLHEKYWRSQPQYAQLVTMV